MNPIGISTRFHSCNVYSGCSLYLLSFYFHLILFIVLVIFIITISISDKLTIILQKFPDSGYTSMCMILFLTILKYHFIYYIFRRGIFYIAWIIQCTCVYWKLEISVCEEIYIYILPVWMVYRSFRLHLHLFTV